MNNLTRWDPFREMMTWRDAMDRLFDFNLAAPATQWQPAGWSLALDLAETDDAYMVKASLPGINPDDLEITYQGNVLTIKGETREDKDVKEEHYHLRERRYGSFARSVTLPTTVKAEAIDARYEGGVLTLNLPKVEEAKPKRIPVQNVASQKVIEGKATDITGKN